MVIHDCFDIGYKIFLFKITLYAAFIAHSNCMEIVGWRCAACFQISYYQFIIVVVVWIDFGGICFKLKFAPVFIQSFYYVNWKS